MNTKRKSILQFFTVFRLKINWLKKRSKSIYLPSPRDTHTNTPAHTRVETTPTRIYRYIYIFVLLDFLLDFYSHTIRYIFPLGVYNVFCGLNASASFWPGQIWPKSGRRISFLISIS